MCKAFSCICLESGDVVWKLGTDSHEDLIQSRGLTDRTIPPTFARVEITPDNGDYRKPDKWTLRIDEKAAPSWWSPAYAAACMDAHAAWSKQLYAILDCETRIQDPFAEIKPPKRITKKHLALLRKWTSVLTSVRDSVGDSVLTSVRDSVRDSAGASVGDSVRDSVWAQIGGLFVLPRSAWQYTESIRCAGYPFKPAVDLWRLGLVPVYDGTEWALLGGPTAGVLWRGEP